MANIPQHLIDEITSRRAVLFLGAGASFGAQATGAGTIPMGKQLGELLAAEFLGAGYEHLDFRTIYDYACSSADVLRVQSFVHKVLFPFEPAPYHELIPQLPWGGIIGTNWDLVVERAYSKSASALQLLDVNRSDASAQERLSADSILYVKLHGCISQNQIIHPPLVASTDQLISFREGRVGQFDTFLEWAKTRTIIFCGYAFGDSNFRLLLDQIIKEGDGRPTHYIVDKTVLPAQQKYWADRRFTAIAMTFEELLRGIDVAIPLHQRQLSLLSGSNTFHSYLTKFITVPGRVESTELRSYLQSSIEIMGDGPIATPVDAKQFYRGFDLGWAPIANNLDVRLPIMDQVLEDEVLASQATQGPRLVVIKGHAGSGKSVAIRRICYEAAVNRKLLCLFASRLSLIDDKKFEEIFTLTNQHIYLFIDNISYHRNSVMRLYKTAKTRRTKLTIIATESYNLWNTQCQELNTIVDNEFPMRYLSEDAIVKLLANLKQHKSLGYLASLPEEKQREELKLVHGRQILVALLEATHGKALQEIVVDEYKSITPQEAQQLYLDICSLHRLGPPVRAGLISRVHNISFDEFEERLFKPLEEIVRLRLDSKSGDYVFEARHSEIATVLYDLVLTDPNARFDNLVRIISKLNPSYSYDMEALSRILRADTIKATLPDEAKARQIYDVAQASVGEVAFVLHQRGVYEMNSANNMGRLVQAEDYLQRATAAEPHNRSIQHSLAELDLRRSRVADDDTERRAWRRSAEKQASALAAHGTSPYPYHTLLKAAVDEVQEALKAAETADDDVAVRHLSESITAVEDILRKAYQKYPNDPMLLAEEGDFSQVLSEAGRAERAFERSFEANPRSTLIARRVARIKRSKQEFTEAAAVLRTCLEHNPSSREINFDLAMTILESAPDADQIQGDEVLYRLRRAFSPGDRHLQAQFWYARQLVLHGQFEEAKNIFADLASSRIAFSEKQEVRGIVRDALGAPRWFHGQVSSVASTFGFLRSDEPPAELFFAMETLPEGLESKLKPKKQARFSMGFTFRGPVALEISV